MTITMTREALLKTLNERLAAAKAEDARAKGVHEAEEQKALDVWKKKVGAACDRFLKMTYEQAKKDDDAGYGNIPKFRRPSCPDSDVWKIEAAIKAVTLDMRKNELYQIQDASDLYAAVSWLPPSKRPAKSLCAV